MGLDEVLEEAILSSAVREHGDKAPAVGVDVAHVGRRAQLRVGCAVGDVEERGSAEHDDELVPDGHMGDVVVGVAVADAQRHGHRPVRGDGQGVDQLAQVRAKVLVVSEGDDDRCGSFPTRRCAAVS